MRSPARADRPGGLRPDIQGLRALAVLAVVADHVLGRPSGGYAGVDVFFVVSGFLITGLLLREHRRSGRVSVAAGTVDSRCRDPSGRRPPLCSA